MSQTTSPVDALDVNEVIAEAFPETHIETLSALAGSGRLTAFPAGETILNQGDEGRVVLVVSGYVGLRRTTIDGRQLTTRIASRGELATILPLAARPSAADLIALSACRVLMWLPSKARALAENDPGFAMAINDHVLASIETMVERVDGLVYQDAVTRVARVLYAHQDLFFSEPPVLTRAHLPALVGTSREMTSRVLRILETRGMVARVGRDRLAIIDAEALEQTVVEPSGVRPRDIRNKFTTARGKRTPGFGGAGRPPMTHGRRSPGRPAPSRLEAQGHDSIEREAPIEQPPGSIVEPSSGTETLIVVEDEPTAREMTKATLERAGYRIIAVADAQAAIEALAAQTGSNEVLIADVVMPNVSGLELAEAIIERDPRIGLVLLSRYTAETLDLARVRAHGAVFVAIPETASDLFDAVRSATPVAKPTDG